MAGRHRLAPRRRSHRLPRSPRPAADSSCLTPRLPESLDKA
jgi:hypothetical protein